MAEVHYRIDEVTGEMFEDSIPKHSSSNSAKIQILEDVILNFNQDDLSQMPSFNEDFEWPEKEEEEKPRVSKSRRSKGCKSKQKPLESIQEHPVK